MKGIHISPQNNPNKQETLNVDHISRIQPDKKTGCIIHMANGDIIPVLESRKAILDQMESKKFHQEKS